MRLRDVSEAELLARVFPVYSRASAPPWGSVPVGPGDDAAVVGTPSGAVVATTDSMVRGRDWRDEWSSAHDVGVKVATQNLADVAAMGAAPTALLVSLVADPDLDVEWAVDLARGIASVAEAATAPVVGGDLSSGPPGVVVVTVTALGDLRGRPPVLRSGARVGRRRRGVRLAGPVGRGARAVPRGGGRPRPGGVRRGRGRPHPRGARPHAAPPGAGGPVVGRARGRAGRGARPHRRLRRSGHRPRPGGGGERGVGRPRRCRAAPSLRRRPAHRGAGAAGGRCTRCSPGARSTRSWGRSPTPPPLPAGGEEAWHVIGRVQEAGEGGPRVTVDGVVPDAAGWDHFAGTGSR